eukprot:2367939-Pyramimonas_sp.AAC.1
MHRPRSFAGCTIIHANTRVEVRREKGKDRAEVPVIFKRLVSMWEAMLEASDVTDLPVDARIDITPCLRCKSASEAEHAAVCALCLCAFHERCASDLVGSLSDGTLNFGAPPTPDDIRVRDVVPLPFQERGLCSLCQNWVTKSP